MNECKRVAGAILSVPFLFLVSLSGLFLFVSLACDSLQTVLQLAEKGVASANR